MNDTRFADAARRIEARRVETGTVSLAVAVAQGDAILYEAGFGMADREACRPASPDTLYSLASITKPITATALMVLVERGQVELDRPFNDYLGGAKLTAHLGAAADATVRRVANHTAGLPTHVHFFYEDEGAAPPPFDETIHRYGHLMAPPGEGYLYANSGYGFLQYLIERVSGKSFARFLRDELFEPLAMTRTALDVPPGLADQAAARYAPDGRRLPGYTFDHPGASAVWASAHDLVRFGLFHLKARLPGQRAILTDRSIEAMRHPAPHGYGIGWRTPDLDCGPRTVGHGGSMAGVRTHLLLVPDAQIAAVALANSSSPLPLEAVTDLTDVLLPGYAEARRARQPAPGAKPVPPPGAPPDEWRGRWEGRIHTYEGERDLALECRPDGSIEVRLAGQAPVPLRGARCPAGGPLTGVFDGSLGIAFQFPHPYELRVSLVRRGDRLAGPTYVRSMPTGRLGNMLGFWTALCRA